MPTVTKNDDPYLLPTLNTQVEELNDIKSRFLEKRARNQNQDGDIQLLSNLYTVLGKIARRCNEKINMHNYDVLAPFITELSYFLQTLLGSFTNDFIKYDPIESSKEKQELIIKFIKEWQKRCLLRNNYSSLIKEFTSEMDDLLWVGAKLRLHHLELLPLDKQIERLEHLNLEHRNQDKKYVIDDLKKIRCMIREDLDDQFYCKKIHSLDTINQSPAIEFAIDTAETISKLTFDPRHLESETEIINNYADTYKTLAAQEPKLKNFGKSIGTLLVSLSFLLVAGTIGACVGLFTNPWAMFILGGLASMMGADIGLDVGKQLTGIPKRESTWRHLFFRPTVFNAAGMNLAKKTEKLLEHEEHVVPEMSKPSVAKKVRFAV